MAWNNIEMTGISIHALREEGDALMATLSWCSSHFYPRPPRGGRLVAAMKLCEEIKFLSTPSVRRATVFDNRNNAV